MEVDSILDVNTLKKESVSLFNNYKYISLVTGFMLFQITILSLIPICTL